MTGIGNRTTLPLAAAATVAAAVIALAGCSNGTSGSGMSGMDHGNSGPATSSTATSSTAPAASEDHNTADITFAQMMIPHHAQAIEMSDLLLAKTDVPQEVAALATRIKAAQGPEIQAMTAWLKSWNQPTDMMPGHSMTGMMDDADLDRLRAAQGTEAARLFLTQMIAHHEGAIEMATSESTAGKNADAVDLSKSIAASQEAEIKEMQDLLATL